MKRIRELIEEKSFYNPYTNDGIEIFDGKFNDIKSRIVCTCVNREYYKDILDKVPHIDILDISIVFEIEGYQDGTLEMKGIIGKEMLDLLKVSTEEMFVIAMKNTRLLRQTKVTTLYNVVKDLSPKDADISVKSVYYISNKRGIKGAITILYLEILMDLSNRLDSDLYLIPSSIHEFMVVSSSEYSVDDLRATLHEANKKVVIDKEFLSNNIYLFDKKSKNIRIIY